MKAYLIGDKYWIHPSQSDKFPEFLNNPEYRNKGKSITGVKALIDF